MSALTYPEAIVIGLLQGVSELFPVSSLGHSVLVPALIGGQWAHDLDMSAPGSPYLDALVAMHVATATALILFFWRDWVRIIGGLFTSVRDRTIQTSDQRLAWLLIVGTIPVGIAGVALDKIMREYLGKPVPAAIFLTLNGLVLFTVERLTRSRRHAEPDVPAPVAQPASAHRWRGAGDDTIVIPVVSPTEATTPLRPIDEGEAVDARLARLGFWEALTIGACQILALLPGISRSGITIVGGLLRGLRHEDAARFAFLLATPVILAAGLLKMPELLRPEMHGALGPALLGSLAAGIAAYISVRFLTRYFETRTLNPFAIYCVVGGLGCLVFLGLTGA